MANLFGKHLKIRIAETDKNSPGDVKECSCPSGIRGLNCGKYSEEIMNRNNNIWERMIASIVCCVFIALAILALGAITGSVFSGKNKSSSGDAKKQQQTISRKHDASDKAAKSKKKKKKKPVPVKYNVYYGSDLVGTYDITKVSTYTGASDSCVTYSGKDVTITASKSFLTIETGKGKNRRCITYTGPLHIIPSADDQTAGKDNGSGAVSKAPAAEDKDNSGVQAEKPDAVTVS